MSPVQRKPLPDLSTPTPTHVGTVARSKPVGSPEPPHHPSPSLAGICDARQMYIAVLHRPPIARGYLSPIARQVPGKPKTRNANLAGSVVVGTPHQTFG